MNIARYHHGEKVSLSAIKTGGVAYWHGNRYWRLGDKSEVKSEDVDYGTPQPERGPFERS